MFEEIILHRKLFTPIKTVDYSALQIENLKFIPQNDFLKKYENDYVEMQENMIYGESLSFKDLINRLVPESSIGNNERK